jgi:hypothetical protein
MIVALVRTPSERMSLRAAAGDTFIQFCDNADSTVSALSATNVVAVVLEIQGDSGADLDLVQRAIALRVETIPLLIRFDLRRDVIRKVLEYDGSALDTRFSLRGRDVLSQCMARLLASTESDAAHRAIFSRVVGHVRREVLDIVACAAIVGDRRAKVTQLATLCQRSGRNVEERLADVGLMGPKRLLMRVLAIHTHWRVSHLGWSAKRAAAAAAYDGAGALSRCIERTTGLTLVELCRTRSIDDELDRLVLDLT